MLLTLFCDASFSPCGAAGWGAWAKRDGWGTGVVIGGQIPIRLANSTEAELWGIAHAVESLHRTKVLDPITGIMIQCDNVAALGAILWSGKGTIAANKDRADLLTFPKRKSVNSTEREAVGQILAALPHARIYLRHVKGHYNGGGTRSWVNRRCDAEARKHMLAVRKRIS